MARGDFLLCTRLLRVIPVGEAGVDRQRAGGGGHLERAGVVAGGRGQGDWRAVKRGGGRLVYNRDRFSC